MQTGVVSLKFFMKSQLFQHILHVSHPHEDGQASDTSPTLIGQLSWFPSIRKSLLNAIVNCCQHFTNCLSTNRKNLILLKMKNQKINLFPVKQVHRRSEGMFAMTALLGNCLCLSQTVSYGYINQTLKLFRDKG